MPSASRTLMAHLAVEHRRKRRDPKRIAELRKQIRDVKAEEHIQRLLAETPPLSQATRDRLAALLSAPSGDQDHGPGAAA